MNSITKWVLYLFMNSKNSIPYNPHRLLLNFTDKINLKRSYKYIALLILSIYYP